VAALAVVGVVALFVAMRPQGIAMVTSPMDQREKVNELPSDYGMPYEEVTVTTADGLADDQVNDIAIGPDGAVWFGTSGGVSRYLPPR